MFNKQMGGRSGSASVSEAKGVLGETDRQQHHYQGSASLCCWYMVLLGMP